MQLRISVDTDMARSYPTTADIANPDTSFLRVREFILQTLPELADTSGVSRRVKRDIQRQGSRGARPDYGRFALAFNQAYFFRNLFKNMLLFEVLRPEFDLQTDRIADVGAGAGVASIACLQMRHARPSSWYIIDTSRDQMALATRILPAVSRQTFSFVCDDVYQCSDFLQGVVLASYWLCEQDSSQFTEHLPLVDASHVFMIDYPSILDAALSSLSRTHHYKRVRFAYPLRGMVKAVLGETELEVTGCYARRK